MLLAYLHLAARRSELFRLRWEDIDFSRGEVKLWTRKRLDGNLEFERLPMTEDLYTALLRHKQNSKSSEWVFPDPETGQPYTSRQKWLPGLCKKAGVKQFGIHAIRHLTASMLAQSNVPMVMIQTILRHKSLATTERYVRRLDDLKPVLRVLSRDKSRQTGPSRAFERDMLNNAPP